MKPRETSVAALFVLYLHLPVPGQGRGYPPDALRIEPRTEYLKDPVGIDSRHPRFTWRLEAVDAGLTQQGYLLTVSSDSNDLKTGTRALWRTQAASTAQRAEYAGRPLQPFTTYYWQVTIRDGRGRIHASPVARFETGMMDVSDWKGAWISDEGSVDLRAAPHLRKEFEVRRPIRSARASRPG